MKEADKIQRSASLMYKIVFVVLVWNNVQDIQTGRIYSYSNLVSGGNNVTHRRCSGGARGGFDHHRFMFGHPDHFQAI